MDPPPDSKRPCVHQPTLSDRLPHLYLRAACQFLQELQMCSDLFSTQFTANIPRSVGRQHQVATLRKCSSYNFCKRNCFWCRTLPAPIPKFSHTVPYGDLARKEYVVYGVLVPTKGHKETTTLFFHQVICEYQYSSKKYFESDSLASCRTVTVAWI